MTEADTVAAWLVAFDAALVARPARRERILAEVGEHLRDAVAAGAGDGGERDESERRVLREFGTPVKVAAQFGVDPGGLAQHGWEGAVARFDRWRPRHPWIGALAPTDWPPMLLLCLLPGKGVGLALALGLPLWLSGALEGRAVRASSPAGFAGYRALVKEWRLQHPGRRRFLAWLSVAGLPIVLLVLGLRHGDRTAMVGLAVLAVFACALALDRVAPRRPKAPWTGRRSLDQVPRLLSLPARLSFYAVVFAVMGPRGSVAHIVVMSLPFIAAFEVPHQLVAAQRRRRAMAEALAGRATA